VAVLDGTCTIDIDAPVAACWSVLEDVPRWPEWTSSFESITVIDRDEQGRAVVCDAVSDAKTRKVRVRVQLGYEPPQKLSMTMLDGDLDSMSATWELRNVDGSRTSATYTVAIDLGPVGALLRGPLKGMAVRFLAKRRVGELAKRARAA